MGTLDAEIGAIFDAALAALAHMGHRLDEAEDCRSPRSWRRSRRSCSASRAALRQNVPPERFEQLEAPTRATVADGERISVGDYVHAVDAARRGTAAVLEAMAPFELVVSPVLTRAALPLDAVPRRRRPRRALAGRVRVALLHRRRSTSRASPRSRCPAAPRPSGLPVGLQIAGPPGADALVLALGAALERALA